MPKTPVKQADNLPATPVPTIQRPQPTTIKVPQPDSGQRCRRSRSRPSSLSDRELAVGSRAIRSPVHFSRGGAGGWTAAVGRGLGSVWQTRPRPRFPELMSQGSCRASAWDGSCSGT